MSDAPAAFVTENGVPPFTQNTVEEAPGFKVYNSYSFAIHIIIFIGLRWQPRVLYHG